MWGEFIFSVLALTVEAGIDIRRQRQILTNSKVYKRTAVLKIKNVLSISSWASITFNWITSPESRNHSSERVNICGLPRPWLDYVETVEAEASFTYVTSFLTWQISYSMKLNIFKVSPHVQWGVVCRDCGGESEVLHFLIYFMNSLTIISDIFHQRRASLQIMPPAIEPIQIEVHATTFKHSESILMLRIQEDGCYEYDYGECTRFELGSGSRRTWFGYRAARALIYRLRGGW